MSSLHRLVHAPCALAIVFMTAGGARAQSSLWDSLIWDQDVWYAPEPDATGMAVAGFLALMFLARARRPAARVES